MCNEILSYLFVLCTALYPFLLWTNTTERKKNKIALYKQCSPRPHRAAPRHVPRRPKDQPIIAQEALRSPRQHPKPALACHAGLNDIKTSKHQIIQASESFQQGGGGGRGVAFGYRFRLLCMGTDVVFLFLSRSF